MTLYMNQQKPGMHAHQFGICHPYLCIAVDVTSLEHLKLPYGFVRPPSIHALSCSRPVATIVNDTDHFTVY